MSAGSYRSTESERWRAFLESQLWERGHLDQAAYWAFLRAGSLGVNPAEALETVAGRIKAAGDHPKPGKLNQQLRRAYAFAGASKQTAGNYRLPKEARPTFLPEYARKFAERVPANIDQAWLRKNSPVKVPYLLSPAEFLSAIYEMGDKVLLFNDYRSQGQELWQKTTFHCDRDELVSFVNGHAEGVWFLPQPIDGRSRYNQRQQTYSCRSEESITSFRFAVLESDCQPLEQWLRILIQLPLPIVSITSSGGKSLHAIVRVDASSKLNWDQQIRSIKPRLICLGADPNALTAVRLTRLPNCYRGDRLQELIYLNPIASGQPIWRNS